MQEYAAWRRFNHAILLVRPHLLYLGLATPFFKDIVTLEPESDADVSLPPSISSGPGIFHALVVVCLDMPLYDASRLFRCRNKTVGSR